MVVHLLSFIFMFVCIICIASVFFILKGGHHHEEGTTQRRDPKEGEGRGEVVSVFKEVKQRQPPLN